MVSNRETSNIATFDRAPKTILYFRPTNNIIAYCIPLRERYPYFFSNWVISIITILLQAAHSFLPQAFSKDIYHFSTGILVG